MVSANTHSIRTRSRVTQEEQVTQQDECKDRDHWKDADPKGVQHEVHIVDMGKVFASSKQKTQTVPSKGNSSTVHIKLYQSSKLSLIRCPSHGPLAPRTPAGGAVALGGRGQACLKSGVWNTFARKNIQTVNVFPGQLHEAYLKQTLKLQQEQDP